MPLINPPSNPPITTSTSTDLTGFIKGNGSVVSADNTTYISNSLVDAKGDLITASADNTPARLAVGSNGYYPIADSSQTTGLKYKAPDGWNEAFETWEYVSVDDPTGIFRVNVDVTAKYSAGMRIKFTNATNVIYGIITVVGAYSGGYTSITFLHQIDTTDSLALYLIANSAITANYYSTQKVPQGFPLDPNKWTVKVTDSGTIRQQLTATFDTWYELYSGLRLNIPIGLWIPKYIVKGQLNISSASSNTIFVTLSTSSATESSSSNTVSINGSSASTGSSQYFEKELLPLSLTSKTTYYLNTKGQWDTSGGRTGNIYNRADDLASIIKVTCAYL